MDNIDRKILTILQQNARTPLKVIAEQVFLSSPAVSARIERLEAAGYILGYQAQLSCAAMGYQIKAFINLEVEPSQKPEFYAVFILKPLQNQKIGNLRSEISDFLYTWKFAKAALRLCFYASGSIAEMPRCSTGVEKTICVRVRPKRCSWLINWSSSCVVWKQTSTSME